MWTYEQRTGAMFDANQVLVGMGYSGAGEGKNNPDEEYVQNIGPIPEGFYDITGLRLEDGHRGPFVLELTPDAGNHMFGRSGFLIHGDTTPPGNASEGCIIQDHETRVKIWESGDRRLKVVERIEA